MEARERPPFSAHAVASLSLTAGVGKVSVARVCRLFGISRQAWYEAHRPTGQLELPIEAAPTRVATAPARSWATAEALEAGIRAIVAKNPAWGVRKVWATLRRAPHDIRAGRKRVWAMMKALGLLLPAEGGPRRVEPRRGQVVVEQPNRRWATDLTTVYTQEDGLQAVIPVLDCGCRTVLALAVSKSQESAAVLAPLREALAAQFGQPRWVADGLELRSDHGPQYTGRDCEALCEEWKLDHTFAPVGRPTGNAAAERLIKTMKEECIWLRDWKSAAELREALSVWMEAYNNRRPHQALTWQTPAERRSERLDAIPAAA